MLHLEIIGKNGLKLYIFEKGLFIHGFILKKYVLASKIFTCVDHNIFSTLHKFISIYKVILWTKTLYDMHMSC